MTPKQKITKQDLLERMYIDLQDRTGWESTSDNMELIYKIVGLELAISDFEIKEVLKQLNKNKRYLLKISNDSETLSEAKGYSNAINDFIKLI